MSFYLVVGLGGMGVGLLLTGLVDWMGTVRGLREGERKRAPGWVVRGTIAVLFALVLVGLAATNRDPVAVLHRGVVFLVLLGSAEADSRWGVVPNELILFGVVVGLTFVVRGHGGWPVLGAGLGTAALLFLVRQGAVWVIGSPGFGMGDVKIGAVLGLFLGWHALWALYLAVLVVGTVGLVGLVQGVVQRSTRIPFAPFVVLGTVLHWFVLPFDRVANWLLV